MKTTHPSFDRLADDAFVRQSQLVGSPNRPEIVPILPIGKSTLWRKVRAGTFPAPVRLTEKCTAWRVSDIRAWLAAQTGDTYTPSTPTQPQEANMQNAFNPYPTIPGMTSAEVAAAYQERDARRLAECRTHLKAHGYVLVAAGPDGVWDIWKARQATRCDGLNEVAGFCQAQFGIKV